MAVFVICAILLSRLFFVNGVNNEVFNHCIRSSPNPGIVQCIGQQTLSSLQYLDKSDNFSIDNGFRLVRTDFERERSLDDFLVDDPTDFRGILDNAGTIFGKRSMQWDLSMIEPGLQLRVGPTLQADSVLEFAMDPVQNHDRYLMEEPSTGRIITRQFIVPFLLGLKFNLITMLPLVFAGIVLLLKKAVFLGKFAIFVTGLLGAGGLSGIGQFSGINNYFQPQRPFLFGGQSHHVPNNGLGTFGDGITNGYYKSDLKSIASSPVHYHESTVTEKEPPQYADQFYNYETKTTITKPENKEPKNPGNRSARANSYRNFAWQSD